MDLAAPATLGRRPVSAALAAFAADVGPEGPVTCVGGRTQWHVGGPPDPAAREVRAPAGVLEYQPAEMTVRCGAGTPVAALASTLADAGQTTVLPDFGGSTVGGVLAAGRSGIRRLGDGPLRDALLEVRYVSAAGAVVTGGGPVVKNVTGFDLCRLLVGSLGTLGLLGEVVLRCRPLPPESRWYAGAGDPFAVRHRLHRPVAVLWDGTTTWVLVEGHPRDLDAQAARLPGFEPVPGPPPLPAGRRSLRPAALRALTGTFVAEVGVGIVHGGDPGSDPEPEPVAVPPGAVLDVHRRLKAAFDPAGRLNPGRRPF